MISGTNVDLTLVLSEEDAAQVGRLYMDLEDRSEFDHTELNSPVWFVAEYKKNGLWSSSTGYMIVRAKAGDIIGAMTYRMKSNIEAVVGYRIYQQAQRGHGFGSEALQLFSDYLFETTRIERITLEIASDNEPSIRTATKSGYFHEGTLRRAYFYRGCLTDTLVFGMLRKQEP